MGRISGTEDKTMDSESKIIGKEISALAAELFGERMDLEKVYSGTRHNTRTNVRPAKKKHMKISFNVY